MREPGPGLFQAGPQPQHASGDRQAAQVEFGLESDNLIDQLVEVITTRRQLAGSPHLLKLRGVLGYHPGTLPDVLSHETVSRQTTRLGGTVVPGQHRTNIGAAAPASAVVLLEFGVHLLVGLVQRVLGRCA